MNITDRTAYILELERKNKMQQVKGKLTAAKYRNQEAAINSGLAIIVAQMEINTMTAFAGVVK
tara:strand:+ start:471 stop:659 length:189 start_codon:yes stop_codon:yes gene_type:complete